MSGEGEDMALAPRQNAESGSGVKKVLTKDDKCGRMKFAA
jgi:hypothetical protein